MNLISLIDLQRYLCKSKNMAKKFKQQNIRKLTRVGGGVTYSITLPILKWQEKQKLIVSLDRKK